MTIRVFNICFKKILGGEKGQNIELCIRQFVNYMSVLKQQVFKRLTISHYVHKSLLLVIFALVGFELIVHVKLFLHGCAWILQL